MGFEEGTKMMIMAPVIRQRKGTHEKIIERIKKEGFTRIRVDGEIKIIFRDLVGREEAYEHLH